MLPQSPGVQGASLSSLNSPQGVLKVCSCSNRGVQSLQRQMENALVFVQLLANALVKC